ncbi:MAG: hypothetical protein WD801_01570 [Gemmatimonadaceae bacterium]
MDSRQARTIASFRHILVFLDQHPITPEPPLLTEMRKSLEASMNRLHRLGAEQQTSWSALGKNVEQRRKELRRERMMPLVRIARPLMAFAPGVERPLRVPHARASARQVADAALAMADALKGHTTLLRSAGFPKDFLKEFRHEARQLARAIKQTNAVRDKRATATAAVAAEMKKAMTTVTVIEGLVMLHFSKDRATIKYWRERRRVSARLGRPRRRNGARVSEQAVVH